MSKPGKGARKKKTGGGTQGGKPPSRRGTVWVWGGSDQGPFSFNRGIRGMFKTDRGGQEHGPEERRQQEKRGLEKNPKVEEGDKVVLTGDSSRGGGIT